MDMAAATALAGDPHSTITPDAQNNPLHKAAPEGERKGQTEQICGRSRTVQ